MSDREKRIEALEREAKGIAAAVQNAEKNMTQLSLTLEYLKKRYTDIIFEMVSLGKTSISAIVEKSVEDL